MLSSVWRLQPFSGVRIHDRELLSERRKHRRKLFDLREYVLKTSGHPRRSKDLCPFPLAEHIAQEKWGWPSSLAVVLRLLGLEGVCDREGSVLSSVHSIHPGQNFLRSLGGSATLGMGHRTTTGGVEMTSVCYAWVFTINVCRE